MRPRASADTMASLADSVTARYFISSWCRADSVCRRAAQSANQTTATGVPSWETSEDTKSTSSSDPSTRVSTADPRAGRPERSGRQSRQASTSTSPPTTRTWCASCTELPSSSVRTVPSMRAPASLARMQRPSMSVTYTPCSVTASRRSRRSGVSGAAPTALERQGRQLRVMTVFSGRTGGTLSGRRPAHPEGSRQQPSPAPVGGTTAPGRAGAGPAGRRPPRDRTRGTDHAQPLPVLLAAVRHQR